MAAMQQSLRLALTFAGLTFVAQAILAALSLKINTVLAAHSSDLYLTSLINSTLDLIGVSIVFVLALSLLPSRRCRWLIICYTLASLVSFTSLGLSIYLFSRLYDERQELEAQDAFFAGPSLPGTFAVWSVSFLSHITLYVVLFRSCRSERAAEVGRIEKQFARSLTTHSGRGASAPLSVVYSTLASPTPAAHVVFPPVPTLHATYHDPKAASLRPVTSRTRLLKPASAVPKQDERRSDVVRHDDGFQDWDTSGVPRIESAGTPPLARTHLEPIPGSRPVSPAKALDGPFEDASTSPSPQVVTSHSEVSLPATVKRQSSASSLPSNRSRASSFHQTRRPSTAQSNVHPLFRSESPHPPPIPSPNTIIMASPLAGQVVGPDSTLGGKRAASRPASLHSSRVGSPSPSKLSQSHVPLPAG